MQYRATRAYAELSSRRLTRYHPSKERQRIAANSAFGSAGATRVARIRACAKYLPEGFLELDGSVVAAVCAVAVACCDQR